MIQVIEMTKEQKVAMYMKLSKRELIEMLISANNHLDAIGTQIHYPYPDNPPGTWTQPDGVNPIWLYDPNSQPFYTTISR